METIKPDTLKTCSALGISAIQGKLTNLRNIARIIQNSIVAVSKAKSHKELIASLGLSLKLTKATCDSFIALTADAMELVGLGSAGKVVNAGYSGLSAVAEAGAKSFAGQPVDWGKTRAIVSTNFLRYKGAQASVNAQPINNLIAQRLGTNMPPSIGIQNLARQQNLGAEKLGYLSDILEQGIFSADFVISRVNGDEDGMKDSVVGYAKSVGTMGAGAANPKLGNIVSMVSEMDNYSRALEKAFDEFSEDQDTSALEGSKRSLEKQLINVHALIARFQAELLKCVDNVRKENRYRPILS